MKKNRCLFLAGIKALENLSFYKIQNAGKVLLLHQILLLSPCIFLEMVWVKKNIPKNWGSLDVTLLLEGFIRRCTEGNYGRCGNMQGSVLPRNRIVDIAI